MLFTKTVSQTVNIVFILVRGNIMKRETAAAVAIVQMVI